MLGVHWPDAQELRLRGRNRPTWTLLQVAVRPGAGTGAVQSVTWDSPTHLTVRYLGSDSARGIAPESDGVSVSCQQLRR